jgi:uncharacterized protein (TIGR03435 family)
MKPQQKSEEKILKETLNLFGKVSPEEAEAARAQTLAYLESHSGEIVEARVWDAESVRPTQRRQWLVLAAIAAAITLAVLIPVTFMQDAPAMLEGSASSRSIGFGEVVYANGATDTLVLQDGSRVEMRAKAELVLERASDGIRIQLHQGGIIVNAAKQRTGHLYVRTKDVTVSVVGTVFLVNAEAEGSRVSVIEGEVRVQQGATEKKLGPGEQVATNPKMVSIPVKEEVAWSREAVTHVASLQAATSAAPTPKAEQLAFEVTTIRPAAPTAVAPGPTARGGGGAGRGSCHRANIQLDPRRLSFKAVSLAELAGWAYGRCADFVNDGVPVRRVFGGPEWMKSEKWDVEALIPEGSVTPLPTSPHGNPAGELAVGNSPKVQQMLRTLLEDRFKLAVRREVREMPVYALTVAPGGPKFQGNDFEYGIAQTSMAGRQPDLNRGTWAEGLLTAADGLEGGWSNMGRCANQSGETCHWSAYLNLTMDVIADALSDQTERPVIDRTGIRDKVSFKIEWPAVPGPQGFRGPLASRRPPLQQLNKVLEAVGLQLKDEPKGQLETFIIERAERPSEN